VSQREFFLQVIKGGIGTMVKQGWDEERSAAVDKNAYTPCPRGVQEKVQSAEGLTNQGKKKSQKKFRKPQPDFSTWQPGGGGTFVTLDGKPAVFPEKRAGQNSFIRVGGNRRSKVRFRLKKSPRERPILSNWAKR